MLIEMLVQEYLLDCQVRQLAEKTVAQYSKQLRYFTSFIADELGITVLEELKAEHIKKYIRMLQEKGSKPTYINDLIKPIKCACSYAYQEGYTKSVITARIQNLKEKKTLIHTFSTDEISRMLKYFNGRDYLSIRNRLILMLFFDTGIRANELITMKPEQIYNGYILIHGKGNKDRVVPIGPVVAKQMLKYNAEKMQRFALKETEDYYFLSKNGKKLTNEGIAKFMKTAAKEVCVNPHVRISPHTCRHTFAQQSLKNGLDLYSLSRLLGHESILITQKYLAGIKDEQILHSVRRKGVLSHL